MQSESSPRWWSNVGRVELPMNACGRVFGLPTATFILLSSASTFVHSPVCLRTRPSSNAHPLPASFFVLLATAVSEAARSSCIYYSHARDVVPIPRPVVSSTARCPFSTPNSVREDCFVTDIILALRCNSRILFRMHFSTRAREVRAPLDISKVTRAGVPGIATDVG
jgi:hypothetical protein